MKSRTASNSSELDAEEEMERSDCELDVLDSEESMSEAESISFALFFALTSTSSLLRLGSFALHTLFTQSALSALPSLPSPFTPLAPINEFTPRTESIEPGNPTECWLLNTLMDSGSFPSSTDSNTFTGDWTDVSTELSFPSLRRKNDGDDVGIDCRVDITEERRGFSLSSR